MKVLIQYTSVIVITVCLMSCSISTTKPHKNSVTSDHLVGIWTTKDAVLNGEFLLEGAAVYLGADGVGALVGGPPPIGTRIVWTFNPNNNSIVYMMTENGKTGRKNTLLYDPDHRTLMLELRPNTVLYRQFDKLTDSTREVLELEPTARKKRP
jgi:hypothetical protein